MDAEEIKWLQKQQDLAETVLASRDAPVRVRRVEVTGTRRTARAAVEALVAPVMDATTLEDAIGRAREAAGRFSRLDAFRGASVGLDSDGRGADGVPEVTVQVHVVEAPRLWAKTGTEIGQYEGSMNLAARVRNVGGHAGSLEVQTSYGVEPQSGSGAVGAVPSGTTAAIAFTQPLLRSFQGGALRQASLRATQTRHTHQALASHDAVARKLEARLTSPAADGRGSHEWTLGWLWRHVCNVAPSASWEMQHEAGHAAVASLGHLYQRDTRDSALLPLRGSFVSVSSELAAVARPPAAPALGVSAPSGSVGAPHAKSELRLSRSWPLWNRTGALIASAAGGALVPLGDRGDAAPLPLATAWADRFHIGGPLSVRGFVPFGLGARAPRLATGASERLPDAVGGFSDTCDELGCDAYWSTGLSLLLPVPRIPHAPLKGHLWANAGQGVLFQRQGGAPYSNLFDTPSLSVGCGLAARFSIMRLEVNYCVPLRAGATDAAKPGLQFGLGLEFL